MTKKSITNGFIAILASILIIGLTPVSKDESHETLYPVSAGGTLVEFRNVRQFDSEVIPWGIKRVGADQVTGQSGKGIKVAILDTGIDLDHPDILVSGSVSFVEGATNGEDDNGHGTQVAGVLGAKVNGFGVVGVSPDVELYAVKVLNSSGEGSWESIRMGIDWAVANKMQVINMSFGSTPDWPESVQAALERAYQAGIILVAGAGNAGNPAGEGETLLAPGRYPVVIPVGAIDRSDKRVITSSTGENLELVAPGESIATTFIDGGYGYVSGTSAAAPYVSGVAALLLGSGVSPAKVRQILCQTAQDLGPAAWDPGYGYGVVDAPEALASPVISMW